MLIVLEIRRFIKTVTVAVQTTHDLALQFALAFSRIGIQRLANAARMAPNDNVPLAQFTIGERHFRSWPGLMAKAYITDLSRLQ